MFDKSICFYFCFPALFIYLPFYIFYNLSCVLCFSANSCYYLFSMQRTRLYRCLFKAPLLLEVLVLFSVVASCFIFLISLSPRLLLVGFHCFLLSFRNYLFFFFFVVFVVFLLLLFLATQGGGVSLPRLQHPSPLPPLQPPGEVAADSCGALRGVGKLLHAAVPEPWV